MFRYRTRSVWLSVFLWLFSACSGPPVEELMQAEVALQQAQFEGAQEYAPEAFEAAAQAMADARSRNERKDYEGARRSALDTKDKAEIARSGIDSGKLRMKEALETDLRNLDTERRQWASSLEKEVYEEQIKQCDEALAEIEARMKAGDYYGARTVLDRLREAMKPSLAEQQK